MSNDATTRSAIAALLVAAACASAPAAERRAGFVDVKTMIPDLIVEMRYATAHNFVGRPIPGYKAARCLLTREAGQALKDVADELRQRGFVLKVYDCYRPQTAVDAFAAWGRDQADQKMKAEFYPDVDKRTLFRDGYIAHRSGHSRGSTLDLTIVPLPAPQQPFDPGASEIRGCDSPAGARTPDGSADMGTGFDCFSPLSHTASSGVGETQRANRTLLHTLMSRHSFRNNRNEWWHYTLADEPYPDTFFDFPVE
jgi:zinc D-Ala-D-Ala dipeptidase